MDMETVIELSRAAPRIRVLELQGFRISSDLLTTLARCWYRHMRVVELCGNAIAEMDMELMTALDRLVAACSSLTGLTVSVDAIGDDVYERAVMVQATGDESMFPPTPHTYNPPASSSARQLAMLSETTHDSAIDLASGSSSSGDNSTSSEEDEEDSVPELGEAATETAARPSTSSAVLRPRMRAISATGLGFLRQERESAVRRAALARWLLLKYRRLEDVVVAAKTPCRGIGNTASSGDGV
ncbi:hypothetical protein BCR44DRAFT_1424835 [Catenaria anguillulae PL171]|uniref:Uncharacterized protein n=1 Tax=Catenaria anguillulae PL171 TaxID=765915 RepID=A0A1Y2I0E5_9FUNG|nr:hypothetical protein BCR44DRAFT_1424835 [Catenaria anguillulae PL171]